MCIDAISFKILTIIVSHPPTFLLRQQQSNGNAQLQRTVDGARVQLVKLIAEYYCQELVGWPKETREGKVISI